jgi:hypothetical protein
MDGVATRAGRGFKLRIDSVSDEHHVSRVRVDCFFYPSERKVRMKSRVYLSKREVLTLGIGGFVEDEGYVHLHILKEQACL